VVRVALEEIFNKPLEVIEDVADLRLIRVELLPISFQHLTVFFVLRGGFGEATHIPLVGKRR